MKQSEKIAHNKLKTTTLQKQTIPTNKKEKQIKKLRAVNSQTDKQTNRQTDKQTQNTCGIEISNKSP